MILTPSQKAQIMTHIVTELFEEDADGDIVKMLAHSGFFAPSHLIDLAENAQELLEFVDDNNVIAHLRPGQCGMLRSFQRFWAHRDAHDEKIRGLEWLQITNEEFSEFRSNPLKNVLPVVASAPTTPGTIPVHARKFHRQSKHHVRLFTKSDDEANIQGLGYNTTVDHDLLGLQVADNSEVRFDADPPKSHEGRSRSDVSNNTSSFVPSKGDD